jgi:hypothetical protein
MASLAEHGCEERWAEREPEQFRPCPHPGVEPDAVLPTAFCILGGHVGKHRQREQLAPGIPDPDDGTREQGGPQQPGTGAEECQHAAAEEERGGEIATLLAAGQAEPLPQR